MVLLDTNIVSFLFKGDNRAKDYAPYLQGQQLAISFMTVAELYQWAAVRQWGQQRLNQLEQTLKTSYIVLAFDIALCRQWGLVRAKQHSIGRPISPEDAWIAATAIQFDLPLVTHNPADFETIVGLSLISVTPAS